MREIKFRVYIKKTKEMLPVVSIVQMNDEEWLRVFPQGYDRNFLESEWDIALMQYIWIKDKNGKEIYEGDLVECIAQEKFLEESWVYPIEYNLVEQQFRPNFACNLWWGWWASIEVVGNIYENPQLVTILIPKSIYVK